MDLETWLWLALVVGCLLFLLAVMIFVVNPPEAWVKRFMQRSNESGSTKRPRQ